MCESFPIIRTGRLATAKKISSEKQVVATYSQGDDIMEILGHKSIEIGHNFHAKLKKKLHGLEVFDPWDNPFPDQVVMQVAQRSRSLAPIFDFADSLIKYDGLLLLVRACVTVCTAEKILGFASREKTNVRSKFWTRVALVAIDEELATDISDDQLEAFESISKNISQISNELLCKPYEAAFSEVFNSPIEISLEESFTFFAVGSDDDSFNSFFEKLRDGHRFKELLGKQSAERLLEIASLSDVFAEQQYPDYEQLLESAADDKDLQLFIFEDNWHYRGVFIGKKSEKSASFVGIAQYPNSSASEGPIEVMGGNGLNQQPAMRVSAQAISEIASGL